MPSGLFSEVESCDHEFQKDTAPNRSSSAVELFVSGFARAIAKKSSKE